MADPLGVALIGLGWHARRIYVPWLEDAAAAGTVTIRAVIEKASTEDATRAYLKERALAPERVLFDETEDAARIDRRVAEALGDLRNAGELDAVIIATDPRAHRRYALWALERDIDLFLDKPISAPNQAQSPAELADGLADDVRVLAEAARRSRSRFVVQTQRRAHAGYAWIRERAREAVETHRVPISFLELYHADGMWVMPGEWDREHHPYKHGAGKLLHSGYHFLDLACWLLACNDTLGAGRRVLDFTVQSSGPGDALARLAEGRPDFVAKAAATSENLEGYGELDLHLLGHIRAEDAVRTALSLQLLQSSFSRRDFAEPPADPYKGAGRVRHERLNLQIGPLMNIQAHSYQCHEVGDRSLALPYGPGHLQHFDVTVYRNSGVIGGAPFEQRAFGREAPAHGHNEDARRRLLSAFIAGAETPSTFADHARTNALLAAIYRALRPGRQSRGRLEWDERTD